MRDFKGVSAKAFDGSGNYTLGLKEQIIFPEIEYDKVDKIKGMNISIVTTARNDEEGRALLKQYSDRNIRNAEVKRLMAATSIGEDASLPRGVSCRMTATLRDGRKLVSQIDYPKGSIQNPMSESEMRAKFDSLAEPVVGARRAALLAEQVMSLEKAPDVSAIMKLTRAR